MIYMWLIIIRAVLSWVQIPSLYSLSVILYHLTEPVLRPVRRFVPPHKMGGIDVSPIIVILIILFIDSFVLKSMSLYAQQILRREALPYY
jgi:YggT family protein